MKTLKLFTIALFTLGTVGIAKAQVSVSINAQFGRPLLPIYTHAPVVVQPQVVYARPVVYPRRVVYTRPAPVYRRNVVVVNRPVYRTRTVVVNRPAYKKVKYYKPGRGNAKHVKHVRYTRY